MVFVTDIGGTADGQKALARAVREAIGASGETCVVLRLRALYRAHVTDDADSAAFLQERRRDEGSEVPLSAASAPGRRAGPARP